MMGKKEAEASSGASSTLVYTISGLSIVITFHQPLKIVAVALPRTTAGVHSDLGKNAALQRRELRHLLTSSGVGRGTN